MFPCFRTRLDSNVMTLNLILVLMFLGVSAVAYMMISSGTVAFESASENMASKADSELRDMFLFANTKKILFLYLSLLVAVPIALIVLNQSPVVIVIAVVLMLMAPRFILKTLAKRRKAAINKALPDALAQVAGAMRAGSTFTSALQSMVEEQEGPLGQEFGLLLREQRLGARLEDALDNLGERVQSEEVDLVISAALIAQEVGGNLAEILQRLSETIRRKMEMEGKIKALTSQGVMQGYVVTALPFFILFALTFLEPEATLPIFSGVLGWGFLFVISIFQLVGGFMIRKIVNIDI